jgi:hypothetical protein
VTRGSWPRFLPVIGDKGYIGEKDIISTPNSHDPPDVRHFKSRAQARQESFKARIKNFACLDVRFRHGIHNHKTCFEAGPSVLLRNTNWRMGPLCLKSKLLVTYIPTLLYRSLSYLSYPIILIRHAVEPPRRYSDIIRYQLL